MSKCAHGGWGQYEGETGPVPAEVEMTPIQGGEECSVCGYRYQSISVAEAQTRMLTNRQTATLDREVR